MTEINKIREHFSSSIKRGTGEAYLIMLENPSIDFTDEIIKASLKNYAYDGQSEGSRGEYLYRLIERSPHQDKIRHRILKRLAIEQKDTWTLVQLFDLAKIFAQNGDEQSKKAIYERFYNHSIEGSAWVGYSEILELDGLAGLKYIARTIGQSLEQNPDDWQDAFIIESFQDENKDIDVFNELEKESENDPYIRIYLDNVRRTEQNRNRHKTQTVEYKDIVDEVLSRRSLYPIKKRGLSDTELNLIAAHFINEKDTGAKAKLLKVFSYYKFPLDNGIILDIAKRKTKKESNLVYQAIEALKFLRSDKIREFALDQIRSSKQPYLYTSILVANYCEGDYKLLTELASKHNNDHIIEELTVSYVEIYSQNSTVECREPLEALYDKLTCGIHRKAIVETLIKNNALSERIRREIQFDSYEDTRALYLER